jgi:SAM-dependent methyltransferase
MADLEQSFIFYGKTALEKRKTWYSSVADAYDRFRPRYPREVLSQVVDVAGLSDRSRLLEVGCGPGVATVDFASFGGAITALEPNPDFCTLAQANCQAYPKVEILNTSFEEWKLEPEAFSAVLAASSFHWIPREIAYPKAAEALQTGGYLILLWNKELQPRYEVYQQLSPVYQEYAPCLDRYESRSDSEEILQALGQIVIDSGYFEPPYFGQVEQKVTYKTDEYLALLHTYSPYLKLEESARQNLFAGLKERIDRDFGGSLDLSFLSAFHIAQKTGSDRAFSRKTSIK